MPTTLSLTSLRTRIRFPRDVTVGDGACSAPAGSRIRFLSRVPIRLRQLTVLARQAKFNKMHLSPWQAAVLHVALAAVSDRPGLIHRLLISIDK
jgi:hypothetical protein